MTENKILLSIRGLTYFVGERRLLDIPQLHITETDHIGIVGENGCGKSTLLDLMAGVRQPESGSISDTARWLIAGSWRQPTYRQLMGRWRRWGRVCWPSSRAAAAARRPG